MDESWNMFFEGAFVNILYKYESRLKSMLVTSNSGLHVMWY